MQNFQESGWNGGWGPKVTFAQRVNVLLRADIYRESFEVWLGMREGAKPSSKPAFSAKRYNKAHDMGFSQIPCTPIRVA